MDTTGRNDVADCRGVHFPIFSKIILGVAASLVGILPTVARSCRSMLCFFRGFVSSHQHRALWVSAIFIGVPSWYGDFWRRLDRETMRRRRRSSILSIQHANSPQIITPFPTSDALIKWDNEAAKDCDSIRTLDTYPRSSASPPPYLNSP